MDTLLLQVLAQQTPDGTEDWFGNFVSETTRVAGYEIALRPSMGVPLVALGLVAVGWILRVILVKWLGGLTAKTESKLDDVLIAGLARMLTPLLSLVFLECVVSSTALAESAAGQRAVLVIAIIVVSFAIVRLLLSLVDAWIASRPNLVQLGPPIKLTLKIGFVPLVALTVLAAVEVEIIQFVTTLGVGSLAVALALQDTLANVFAGIQLVADQPIRAGDFVEIEGGQRGTVHEIGMRSTKIRTLDNNMVIVPNSLLAKTVIVNNEVFDRRYTHFAYVGVGYDSDSRHVQTVLEEVLHDAGQKVDGVLAGPHKVRFFEFGESALLFRLDIRLAQYDGRRGPLGAVNHLIHERFRAEGIEIPFPMRTVVLRHEGRDAGGTRPDGPVADAD